MKITRSKQEGTFFQGICPACLPYKRQVAILDPAGFKEILTLAVQAGGRDVDAADPSWVFCVFQPVASKDHPHNKNANVD